MDKTKLARFFAEKPARIFQSFRTMEDMSGLITEMAKKSGFTDRKFIELLKVLSDKFQSVFTLDAACRWLDLLTRYIVWKPGMPMVHGIEIMAVLEICAAQSEESAVWFYHRLMKAAGRTPLPTSRGSMSKDDIVFNLLFGAHGAWKDGFVSLYNRGTEPSRSIELFYAAAGSGDVRALEVMKCFRIIFGLYNSTPFPDVMVGQVKPWKGQETLTYWKANTDFAKALDLLGMPVEQPEEARTIQQLVEEKFDDIAALCELLWEDIALHHHRDVRSTGEDFYIIKGIIGGEWPERHFIRQDYPFPAVGLATQIEWLDGFHWIGYEISMDNSTYCLENDSLAAASFLSNLAAYHEIVCREPRSPSDRENRLVKLVGEDGIIYTSELIHEKVGDFFRKLRPGWQPSEAKRQECLIKYGHEIPPGVTLVSEFDRDRSVRKHHQGETGKEKRPCLIIEPVKLLRGL